MARKISFYFGSGLGRDSTMYCLATSDINMRYEQIENSDFLLLNIFGDKI
jgi:hypothetical protein